VLHHLYGMSFREIGQIAGVSEGGARIRASRGMSELRLLLERHKGSATALAGRGNHPVRGAEACTRAHLFTELKA
jgi:hypothetical protein